jgi:hypothetical protein
MPPLLSMPSATPTASNEARRVERGILVMSMPTTIPRSTDPQHR